MSQPAILVDDIGKKFRIGRKARKDTLQEALVAAVRSPLRQLRDSYKGGSGTEEFWALKGISFEVQPGEVVGIVGHNGAGKSTLLKILSRITEPTEGCIKLRGRLASLLEVGTGFHPDLTGRENVYLNGSILGMKKFEIDRKFDEIIAFAEIEKFLDTQVKHYSSGMYVRLAFAVAAHLDPEILIVDEVLSVGDASFQKKCLGKIRQVAGGGRTVLFVSHNMPTVLQLCDKVILLKGGGISLQGSPDEVIYEYQSTGQCEKVEVRDLGSLTRSSTNNGGARFQNCRLITPERTGPWTLPFGSRVALEVTLSVHRPLSSLEFGLALCNSIGVEVVSPLSSDVSPKMTVDPGEYTIVVGLPTLTLTPGRYQLDFGIRSDRGMEDHVTEAVFFEIFYNNESSENLMHLRRGSVIPDFEFSINQIQGS